MKEGTTVEDTIRGHQFFKDIGIHGNTFMSDVPKLMLDALIKYRTEIEKLQEDKLKLYVWEGPGVLEDYTNGMICVLAHSLEEALDLIAKKYSWYEFPPEQYKVYTEPEAFAVYGGS